MLLDKDIPREMPSDESNQDKRAPVVPLRRTSKGNQALVTTGTPSLGPRGPHRTRNEPRRPGRLKGRIRIADDFDAADQPIPDRFEQSG